MNKKCILTDEQIRDIKQTIITNGLNKSDSLFDESTKYKSFEKFINLSINMELEGTHYSVRINGDVSPLEKKEFYNNSLKLINFLENLMDSC